MWQERIRGARATTGACLVVAVLLLATAGACTDDEPETAATITETPAATDTPASPSATPAIAAGPNDATEVVQRVRESVVRVRVGDRARAGPFGIIAPAAGTGTGFVIDGRGYIVTNNHVVTLGTDQPATSFEVDLWDGRTLQATLVGRDARTDIAVLKVDEQGLQALNWADAEEIVVGEEVFAIGFALDLGSTPTVTKGVVSAKDRVINETLSIDGRPYRISISGAIQTDAAINPGNSGGPLVDLNGEVVGVNTAGLVSTGGLPVQSIFFAVSAPVARPIVQTLIDEGDVKRGFLGVQVSTLTPQAARAADLPVEAGVRVRGVEDGTAAAGAGLRPGDVITKVGDVEIRNTGDLTRALFRYQPGTTVPVEYIRDGQQASADVTLGDRPDNAE